jgi:hypothetical protein
MIRRASARSKDKAGLLISISWFGFAAPSEHKRQRGAIEQWYWPKPIWWGAVLGDAANRRSVPRRVWRIDTIVQL